MKVALLGPVSSGTPNGPGTVFSWLAIAVAVYVGASAWRHYLKQPREPAVPFPTIILLTAIVLLLIAAGIWGLLRSG
jgi:hypothetical protein